MKKHPAALAAAALALTLTACSAGDGGDDGTAGPASEAPPAAQFGHVHGLGVDPSDDSLYIATHAGLYTEDGGGSVKLVGRSMDDFMGFTVTDDGTLVASGHPALGTDGPGNKGLIRSADRGRTWKTLSLAGESDFHALDHAHGTIYGYDATNGLVRTSRDGVRWKSGATLQATDIAVSPGNPEVVLAATQKGVARSDDGGRTFGAADEKPMAFLSWAADDALYGVDHSGVLYRSADAGASWRRTATVPGGPPQALTALDADRVLVATQGGVHESEDGGETFSQRLPLGG